MRIRGTVSGVHDDEAPDAHLAALAIEHRCEIVTYDTAFGRFDGVTWLTPGDAAAGA